MLGSSARYVLCAKCRMKIVCKIWHLLLNTNTVFPLIISLWYFASNPFYNMEQNFWIYCARYSVPDSYSYDMYAVWMHRFMFPFCFPHTTFAYCCNAFAFNQTFKNRKMNLLYSFDWIFQYVIYLFFVFSILNPYPFWICTMYIAFWIKIQMVL